MPDMTPEPAPSKFVQTSKGTVETAGKRGAPIKTAVKKVIKKAKMH
jgi:hypothetical protein